MAVSRASGHVLFDSNQAASTSEAIATATPAGALKAAGGAALLLRSAINAAQVML